jgi:hypothetical protein
MYKIVSQQLTCVLRAARRLAFYIFAAPARAAAAGCSGENASELWLL